MSFLFRPQRGGYVESMAETREFVSRQAFADWLRGQGYALVAINPYGVDPRNGWDTQIVLVTLPGDASPAAMGFTNRPVPDAD